LAAFGDRYDSGGNIQPKHTAAFQPGEVWFLNPNMLAHEVVYGKRLLDAVFLFDQSGLLDKSRYFPAIAERVHKQKLSPAGYWARRVFNRLKAAVVAKPAPGK
jgi:hypothetical protein